MYIKHKGIVFSILELNNSKIARGDNTGCLSLFSIDYDKNKYTKLTEHEAHDSCIYSLCELSENRLVSASSDYTLKVWNIRRMIYLHI